MLGLIHIDVYGPIMIHSMDRYNVSSLMTILYMVMCIWWKSKSFERFKEFRNTIEIQIGKNIKILRSDRVGEYIN